MATQIASLAVKLSANSAQFTRGMNKARKSTAKFGKMAKAAALQMAALAAGITAVAVKTAKMAMEQEKAEVGLAAAMRVVGDRSKATQRELRRFASELQKITVYGDEALLQLMALGATMGKLSREETKQATVAAIGLSKAFGVELLAAMRLVARARVGDTAQLKRYGIMIDNSLSSIEKFNKLIEIGAKNFSLAAAETETAAGKLKMIGAVWGDVQEKIGMRILGFIKGPGERLMKFLRELDSFLAAPKELTWISDWEGPVVLRIRAMRTELKATKKEIEELTDKLDFWITPKATKKMRTPSGIADWIGKGAKELTNAMVRNTPFGIMMKTKYRADIETLEDREQKLRDDIFRLRGAEERGFEFPEVIAERLRSPKGAVMEWIRKLKSGMEEAAETYGKAMVKVEEGLKGVRKKALLWGIFGLPKAMQELARKAAIAAIDAREAGMEKWRAGQDPLGMPQHRTPAAAIAGTAGGWRAVLRAGDSRIRKQMDTLVIEQRKTREAIERAHEDWIDKQRGALGE